MKLNDLGGFEGNKNDDDDDDLDLESVLLLFVRSRVIVGCELCSDDKVVAVAVVDDNGNHRAPGREEEEVEEPDKSMEAAAEVVEAMGVAERGREWLCVPS